MVDVIRFGFKIAIDVSENRTATRIPIKLQRHCKVLRRKIRILFADFQLSTLVGHTVDLLNGISEDVQVRERRLAFEVLALWSQEPLWMRKGYVKVS